MSEEEKDPKDLFGAFDKNTKWYDPSLLFLPGFQSGKIQIRNLALKLDMDMTFPSKRDRPPFYRFGSKFSEEEMDALNQDEIDRITFLAYPIQSRYVGKPSYIDSSSIGDSLLQDIEKEMSKLIAESLGVSSYAFGTPETTSYSSLKETDHMTKDTLTQWVKMLEENSRDWLERERGIGKGWICVLPLDIAQKLILAIIPDKINSWTMGDLQRITMRQTWIAPTDSGTAEYCDPIWAYARYYPRPYVEPTPKPKPYRRGKRDAMMLGQFQYE